MRVVTSVDVIEPAITRLVQEAPTRDPGIVSELLEALRKVGTPLALVIARTVEYVDDDLIDPGIALPALAEACATLVAGVRGELDQRVLDAAQYQIATLEPMPDRPPKIATPDVSITHLRKRRRRHVVVVVDGDGDGDAGRRSVTKIRRHDDRRVTRAGAAIGRPASPSPSPSVAVHDDDYVFSASAPSDDTSSWS